VAFLTADFLSSLKPTLPAGFSDVHGKPLSLVNFVPAVARCRVSMPRPEAGFLRWRSQ